MGVSVCVWVFVGVCVGVSVCECAGVNLVFPLREGFNVLLVNYGN